MLESLLTGVDYDTVVDNPRWGDSIADNGEDRGVLTVTGELRAALATADAGQLAAVAVPWAQIDEFDGEAEPAHLAARLTQLAALARTATERGQRLDCRVAI